MLTKDQIKQIPNFNHNLVKEAIRQAEQRLTDSLTKKENVDRKALALLSIFLTFATTLLAVLKLSFVEEAAIFLPVLLSGLCFLFGAGFLFVALKASDYGTLGRYPDTWLQDGILNGDEEMQSYVLANVLVDYQDSIKKSDASNERKIKFIDNGITLGMAAPTLFFLFFTCSYLGKIIIHLLQ